MWFIIFGVCLILPITMVGFGDYFKKGNPARKNTFFGYRTRRSLKNMDTWRYAHEVCGTLWVRFGWILILLSSVTLLFYINKSVEDLADITLLIMSVQLVAMLGSIIPVEMSLKKTFDKHGRRIR